MTPNEKVEKVKALLKARAEQKKKEQEEENNKTSNVSTAPTPIERANALKRKEANIYTSRMADKLYNQTNK